MQNKENKLTIDWTDLSMDPKWYDFFTGKVVPEPAKDADGAFLKIAPLPSDLVSVGIREDRTMIFTGEQQKKIYDHCLKEFRGNKIVDAADKPLVFSDAVKEKIFEFDLGGIKNFVITKSREFKDQKAASIKN